MYAGCLALGLVAYVLVTPHDPLIFVGISGMFALFYTLWVAAIALWTRQAKAKVRDGSALWAAPAAVRKPGPQFVRFAGVVMPRQWNFTLVLRRGGFVVHGERINLTAIALLTIRFRYPARLLIEMKDGRKISIGTRPDQALLDALRSLGADFTEAPPPPPQPARDRSSFGPGGPI